MDMYRFHDLQWGDVHSVQAEDYEDAKRQAEIMAGGPVQDTDPLG